MDSFLEGIWPDWSTTNSSNVLNQTMANISAPLAEVIMTTVSTTILKETHVHHHHSLTEGAVIPSDVLSVPEYSNDTIHDIMNVTYMNETGGNYTEMAKPEWYRMLEEAIKWSMLITIIIVMFGMGCAIYWKDIVDNLWPPIGVVIGLCGQFIILPATAFGFSILFQLSNYEAIGALIVSCCPGGAFSNFFTFWVEGELALSIIMTTFSSAIAFGGMPFNLWMYSGYFLDQDEKGLIEIPYDKIFIGLSMVVGPVAIGMVVRHFTKRFAEISTSIASKFGYVGFAFSLVAYFILYWDMFFKCSPLLFAAGIILPVTGFTLAYIAALICKRNHKVCRTIGIETGSQNMPIALNIIFFSFPPSPARNQMALFPTIYGVFMLVEVFAGIIFYRIVRACQARKGTPTTEQATVASANHLELGTPQEKRHMIN